LREGGSQGHRAGCNHHGLQACTEGWQARAGSCAGLAAEDGGEPVGVEDLAVRLPRVLHGGARRGHGAAMLGRRGRVGRPWDRGDTARGGASNGASNGGSVTGKWGADHRPHRGGSGWCWEVDATSNDSRRHTPGVGGGRPAPSESPRLAGSGLHSVSPKRSSTPPPRHTDRLAGSGPARAFCSRSFPGAVMVTRMASCPSESPEKSKAGPACSQPPLRPTPLALPAPPRLLPAAPCPPCSPAPPMG
jgi:hypothetical protein